MAAMLYGQNPDDIRQLELRKILEMNEYGMRIYAMQKIHDLDIIAAAWSSDGYEVIRGRFEDMAKGIFKTESEDKDLNIKKAFAQLRMQR